jgi:glycosyltransferase involved in cell wall biosynthesis
MRIGFVSTRLKGTDGVSLEVEKWSKVLRRMDHELFYCAGELGGYAKDGTLIPKMHFKHPSIIELNQLAFGDESVRENDGEKLTKEILATADEIRSPLKDFIYSNRLDLIVIQNALAIPMNLPLGVCLTGLINNLGIATIAHHHDLYWERSRYQTNSIMDLLDATFPPHSANIHHVTINSIAQKPLKVRRGIDSVVIPNVHDFATPPPMIDEYNNDFRRTLGLNQGDLFVLQPTRVIQRKGIELALELVNRLAIEPSTLFITHAADDEGLHYWHWLEREAEVMRVNLRLINQLIAEQRTQINGRKIYTLWDAYLFADLVTYPSLYEGFGNALLEAIYFKRLVVVNRYPVYNADISPLGFNFIELDGFVDDASVNRTRQLIKDKASVREMTEQNYRIAQEYFSLEVLASRLKRLLNSIV